MRKLFLAVFLWVALLGISFSEEDATNVKIVALDSIVSSDTVTCDLVSVPVQLPYAGIIKSLIVKARHTNIGHIRIGKQGVGGNAMSLATEDTISLLVSDQSTVYVGTDVAGNQFEYISFK